MAKTQIGRSCFKFLKRLGKIKTCEDFYNLYVAETNDNVPYTTLEHYFCSCNSSKYREPPENFLTWCNDKLNRDDSDFAQHFTLGEQWLTKPVKEFIESYCEHGIVDPYAGDCSLRTPLEKMGVKDFIGFDIDEKMVNGVVKHNDSLLSIPSTKRLLVTNPPFMSKCTATRYGSRFYKYFESTALTDIYLIALEKCLASHDNVVAIVPETFLLNGNFTDRLSLIVIVEENIFGNTDCPVLVACFQKDKNPKSKVKIYKNDKYLITLGELHKRDKLPDKKAKITFNEQNGNIGLRGIDGTQSDRIAFCEPEALNYKRKMKVSSRLISLVDVPDAKGKEKELVEACNKILEQYRQDTHDLLMAPFKGNNKSGQRRRRIDYKTARAIIEEALRESIVSKSMFDECGFAA
jgi:hypothetical protein